MGIASKHQEQTCAHSTLSDWEKHCIDALEAEWKLQDDSAHDLAHVMRVLNNALNIAKDEQAQDNGENKIDEDVIRAAVWLHDIINLPKDHPDRAKASVLSALRAKDILTDCANLGFPKGKIEAAMHAIEAHSFSANIETKSIEAKIVQDADRLDAIGAIGIARCFAVSGALGRPLLHPQDPLCEERNPDDAQYAVDHFYVKLFKLPDTMKTKSARIIATKRIDFMREYLKTLKAEQCL